MKIKTLFYLVISILVLCVSTVMYAAVADLGNATALPTTGLNPQTIILIAGIVSAAVEVAKRFFKFEGRVSVVINMAASIGAAYAGAQPETVLSLSFLLLAIQAALTSAGVFATVSTVKGG